MDWVSIHLVLEHIDDLAVIFAEAARALRSGGQLYVSEFHPFRQYLGGKARMERGGNLIEIDSFIHHVSDFYREAGKVGLICHDLSEHLHPEEDPTKTPRLLVLRFQK
jgi:malonyl-CoA O-methyltransferase